MYSTMYLDFIMSFPPEQQNTASFVFLICNFLILAICSVIYCLQENNKNE